MKQTQRQFGITDLTYSGRHVRIAESHFAPRALESAPHAGTRAEVTATIAIAVVR